MALFHPRKVSRLRAWLDARRGVKAGRPLPAYLADKLAVAQRKAPRVGAPPYALSLQARSRCRLIRISGSSGVERPPRSFGGVGPRRARRSRGARARFGHSESSVTSSAIASAPSSRRTRSWGGSRGSCGVYVSPSWFSRPAK